VIWSIIRFKKQARSVEPGERGLGPPKIWSGGSTNSVSLPKLSACYVRLCIMALWYNAVIAESDNVDNTERRPTLSKLEGIRYGGLLTY